MVYKIGILFPTTSKLRDWKQISDTYLYKILLPSFLKTRCSEYEYVLYIVTDDNDKIYTKVNKDIISKDISNNENLSSKFISSSGIKKGHVTEMWNRALENAYNDNCDYFYQCGDDIEFLTDNWTTLSINKLKENNDIGITGPLDLQRLLSGKNSHPGNPRFLQTQAFFSRKHKEIHGFLFPKEIINWYCDDWITRTHYPEYFMIIKNCFIKNCGGKPRYNVIEKVGDKHMSEIVFDLVEKHRNLIKNYILSNM